MKEEPHKSAHLLFRIEDLRGAQSEEGGSPAQSREEGWEKFDPALLNDPEGARQRGESLLREARLLGVSARLASQAEPKVLLEIRGERNPSRRATIECLPNGQVELTLWSGEEWRSRMEVGTERGEVVQRLRSAWAFVERVYDPLPLVPEWLEGAAEGESSVVWALTVCDLEKTPGGISRRRTAGIFDSLEAAHQVLQDNEQGLDEAGGYPYAFLERVTVGILYGVSPRRLWYRFELDYQGYRPGPEPQGLERCLVFGGIG